MTKTTDESGIFSDFLETIAIRIDANTESADFYILCVNNGKAYSRPITDEREQIVLFTHVEQAETVLQQADAALHTLGPAPQTILDLVDVAQVIYLLDDEDVDQFGDILLFINTFYDFLKTINYQMPVVYDKDLKALAHHLFLNRQFSGFLHEHNIERKHILDAVYLMVGAVFSNAAFF